MVSVTREKQPFQGWSTWVLILSNLFIFQLSGWHFQDQYSYPQYEIMATKEASLASKSSEGLVNPLEIPRGTAVALPSVQVNEEDTKYERKNYGGKGDKPHLGGFASNDVDLEGVSPGLWKYMVEEVGVKSLLDVGCGRGVSTSWFQTHGVETLCVEGSHNAVEQTLLPAGILTEHDFSRGPWWPNRTVDAIWCVELLEHVGRNFHMNLIPAFRKAAVIYATHSTWGGWHHVEVHDTEWWIQKFENLGFKYSKYLTDKARTKAREHKMEIAPNGKSYNAQHIWLHMMVFVNPMVAALPEHHHLQAEAGCFVKRETTSKGRESINRPCGSGGSANERETESVLPDSFIPTKLDPSADEKWEKLVFGKSKPEEPGTF